MSQSFNFLKKWIEGDSIPQQITTAKGSGFRGIINKAAKIAAFLQKNMLINSEIIRLIYTTIELDMLSSEGIAIHINSISFGM